MALSQIAVQPALAAPPLQWLELGRQGSSQHLHTCLLLPRRPIMVGLGRQWWERWHSTSFTHDLTTRTGRQGRGAVLVGMATMFTFMRKATLVIGAFPCLECMARLHSALLTFAIFPFATAFLVIGPRPPPRVLWRLNCDFWPWLQPSVKSIAHFYQLMNCLIQRKTICHQKGQLSASACSASWTVGPRRPKAPNPGVAYSAMNFKVNNLAAPKWHQPTRAQQIALKESSFWMTYGEPERSHSGKSTWPAARAKMSRSFLSYC